MEVTCVIGLVIKKGFWGGCLCLSSFDKQDRWWSDYLTELSFTQYSKEYSKEYQWNQSIGRIGRIGRDSEKWSGTEVTCVIRLVITRRVSEEGAYVYLALTNRIVDDPTNDTCHLNPRSLFGMPAYPAYPAYWLISFCAYWLISTFFPDFIDVLHYLLT